MALTVSLRQLPGDVSSSLLETIERRIGLTINGLAVMGMVAIGLVLARATSEPAIYMLSYGLIFVFISALLLGRRRLAVDAERSELPRRVREGQSIEVDLRLQARRRVTTIVLEEMLDPHLGRTVNIPLPLLPAGQEVVHSYRFTPSLRGVYQVGPLVAIWSDPFGLLKRRVVLAEAVEMLVHPTTEAVQDRVLSRAWEDPPIRPPVSKAWPTGFEFYGMQDYQPGDDPRRIVWRASARTIDPDSGAGRYLVRVSEQGITDRVSIIIDNDRQWQAPGDPSETFELAVRAAASIGASHLTDGFAVTIESNAERIADAVRGASKRVALLDSLTRLNRETTPLNEVLERFLRNPRRDSHVILVTPYLSPEAATRVRILIDRGVSVLLALVSWDGSEPGSLHRGGALGCNVVELTSGVPLGAAFNRIHSGGRR